ncbi:MAG: LytR C-terminal domain-containing protein [Patescibacteria group bacterium]
MKKKLPFIQSLKNIKPFDLVYPGVLVLFFALVAIIFFFTIRFISRNINKAFSPEEGGPSQALNVERYKLTAKKLNIPVATSQEIATMPEVLAGVAIPDTHATNTLAVAVLDKSALTIMVKNSTPKKGVASTLAKTLEDSGFKKPQTGNESTLYATTTILLKESKKEYGALLLDAVRKTYPDAVATTASSESGSSDATIIIGTR